MSDRQRLGCLGILLVLGMLWGAAVLLLSALSGLL